MIGVIIFGICMLAISVALIILQVRILREVKKITQESDEVESKKVS